MFSSTSDPSVATGSDPLPVAVADTSGMEIGVVLVAFRPTKETTLALAFALVALEIADATTEALEDVVAASVAEASEEVKVEFEESVLAAGVALSVNVTLDDDAEAGRPDGSAAHAEGTTGMTNETPVDVAAAAAETVLDPSVSSPLSSVSSPPSSMSLLSASLSSESAVSVAVGKDVSVVRVTVVESSVIVALRLEESVMTGGTEVSVPDDTALSAARDEMLVAVAFAVMDADRTSVAKLVATEAALSVAAAETEATGRLLPEGESVKMALQSHEHFISVPVINAFLQRRRVLSEALRMSQPAVALRWSFGRGMS